MNFLAGTLLIFMEEEPAFWMLVYIVEELLSNYFIPCNSFFPPNSSQTNSYIAMSGLLADTQLFELLVSENLPELYRHFQRVHLSMSMFTTAWFLCLFINYIPTEICYLISSLFLSSPLLALMREVWDNIMLDGISVVFEAGLALLRMHQDLLMSHQDQLELTVCLKEHCANLHDPQKLWSHVFSLLTLPHTLLLTHALTTEHSGRGWISHG
jgi:hypothetical protein